MKINWKVRIKNPVFWANLAAAIILPILTYLGLNWSDMTTWAGLWNVITGAFSNPYCLFLVASNIWSALNDPTTSGISDSARAKGYTAPSAE